MLKILQAGLQQYENQELPDVQSGLAREPEIKLVNICWIIEKTTEFQKNTTYASLITLKPLTVWITTSLWKIFKEIGIPGHLTCHLGNLYAGQEATIRIRHGTRDWFQIGKGVHQDCLLSLCLFNLSVEYIM